MSHAMAHTAGIGAHGLWSVSRRLARGLESRGEYKRNGLCDTPRIIIWTGEGSSSLKALKEFTLWFLKVSLDKVTFMSDLFEMELGAAIQEACRAERYLKESSRLLEEALIRGEFDRGEQDALQ